MTTTVKGQPPSTQIRADLKAENRPVLVAMSLGKDAIATNLALKEDGITTELAYLYGVPGTGGRKCLKFVERTISDLEQAFQQKIHCYPHPSLYRMLNHLTLQPPERIAVIEAARLPNLTYEEEWQYIREDLNLPADTWVADGVRAADSIVRRAAFTKHGAMKPSTRKVSPIYDWLKKEVLGIIDQHNIPLPIDYELFGRSFDGIDYRFIKPLKDRFPGDYEQLKFWFPLVDLELMRCGD